MPLGLRRVVLLALAAVGGLVAGIALASCGGEGEATETTETLTTTTETTTTTTSEQEVEKPTVVRIVVVDGAPKGGIVRKSVNQGDRVVVVNSDVADEVRLHGYDLKLDVAAGGTARIAFRANVPGRFEVELEGRGVQIADLTVEP